MAESSTTWIVITIPGDENTPPAFAAYNRELRQSGRVYADRKTAAREARRRNATVARNEQKAERRRERLGLKRDIDKAQRARRKPFIDAIKRADFQAIGVFGDWLQEQLHSSRDIELGERLVLIFRGIANPMRLTKPDVVPESKLPHVARAIQYACLDALTALGELPRRSNRLGVWAMPLTARQRSVARRLSTRSKTVARKIIRADEQLKAANQDLFRETVPA